MDRFFRVTPAIPSSSGAMPSDSNPTGALSTKDKRQAQLREANKVIFGNNSFRTHQQEIVEAALDNKDIFVIMPTGGGKSLCYALPAVLSKGVTVVISPLISLIEDQVSAFIQLPSGGIPCAYLTSTCTMTMANAVFADLRRGKSGL